MSTTATLKRTRSVPPAGIEEPGWRSLYVVAGIAALFALGTNGLDIVVGLGETELVIAGSQTALDWFALFQESGFKGLYLLGVLNIIYAACLIPVYFGLFAAHRHAHSLSAALAMSLYFTGAAVYISNNAAIPMLVLSERYAAATGDVQRTMIAAAGEAVLAYGEDFTPGAFAGMFLEVMAAVVMSIVMLRGGVFGRRTAWAGIIGFALLTVFTVWATFVPVFYEVAFYGFGMIGGLFVLAWFVLVARQLFQFARVGVPQSIP